MTATETDWVIYLRPMPSETPAPLRVRTLLKRARRDLHLHCVLLRDPTAAESSEVNLHEPSCDCWSGLRCNCACE
jgi:hypothetical protein